MHRVDPLGERGVDLLHPFGKQVVVLAESLTLRLVALGLVGLFLERDQRLLLVGLNLHAVVAGFLILALLLLVAGGIDRGGLLRLGRRRDQGVRITWRRVLTRGAHAGIGSGRGGIRRGGSWRRCIGISGRRSRSLGSEGLWSGHRAGHGRFLNLERCRIGLIGGALILCLQRHHGKERQNTQEGKDAGMESGFHGMQGWKITTYRPQPCQETKNGQ